MITAIDTETWLISPGNLAPKMVCMSTHNGGGTSLYLAKDAKEPFLAALQEGAVFANGSFDLAVAAAYWPDVLEPIFDALDHDRVYDVQLIEQLHDMATFNFYRDPVTKAPIKGYSLAFLETRHLGIDRSAQKSGPDVWRLRYHELDGVPLEEWPREAVEYSKADAVGTFEVFCKQEFRAIAPDPVNIENHLHLFNWNCIHDEMRSAFALRLMSCWGIRTDEKYATKVSADIRELHDSSRKKFLAAGLVRLRKAKGGKKPETPDFVQDGKGWKYQTDTKALAARVVAAYEGAPPKTPTGRVQCSRDALAQSNDDLLEAFCEAGENEKLFSTYLGFIELGTKVPINARYRSLLQTGRTSARDPALQTLPRKGPIRECHVPRPGWVYLSCDYSTQESVCLAQVQLNWFGHSALADAINSGQDMHVRMAAGFKGVSYEEMWAKYKEKDPEAKKLRQASKPANFGLPGLLGPPGLVLNARTQYDVRFCEYIDGGQCRDHERTTCYGRRTISPTCVRCLALACELRDRWLEEWPEAQDTLDICIKLFEDNEPLPLLGNGMLITADDKPGSYCNGVFQGLAAQISKRALYEVCQASYVRKNSVLYGNCRPVVFLHDEILAEVREEVAHEVACKVSETMVTVMRKYTPGVAVKAEPALCRRWFKGAEAVFKNGRLSPWWPSDWSWEPDKKLMGMDAA